MRTNKISLELITETVVQNVRIRERKVQSLPGNNFLSRYAQLA